jgi:predicted Ser/Thr protein kinase
MEEPRRLGGRYELGSVLGRGGMAEVYLAHDTRLGRTVAVKTLRVDLARDPSFQARFRREAQSAASLNHPSIVAVYDTGEDYVDGVSVPYIVMEYVDGSTLRELLHSGRKLLPERAMEMTVGVLQALEYSHRAGIVHRDIKPANVMLTRTGQVKVMDFGIARAMGDSGMTMTQTAAVIGTAQYLSPEQAKGEQVDARSDLYSTGCLLYELLTVRPPFVGDSPVAVAYQHVREDPQPPSVYDPEVTPAMDAIVLKALTKDPDYRYQSADEMRADIEAALDGQPVGAAVAMGAMSYGYPQQYGDTAATTALPPQRQYGAGAAPAPQQQNGLPAAGASARRGAGKGTRKGLIATVAACCLAAGVIAGLLVANSGSAHAGSDADPAAKDPASSRPATSAQQQAQALDNLLKTSGGSRTSVVSAVASAKKCDDLDGAATALRTAADQRKELVAQLGTLSVDRLPGHVDLTDALTKAWQASAAADGDYATWAEQIKSDKGQCKHGTAKEDPTVRRANAESGVATNQKKRAVVLWNTIADKFHLPARAYSQL